MSANIDLVRSIHALWSRGDFDAADWAHPDVEFAIPDGPEPFAVSGAEAMGRAWREVLSAWANYRVTAEEYREVADGEVLVLTRYSAHHHRVRQPVWRHRTRKPVWR